MNRAAEPCQGQELVAAAAAWRLAALLLERPRPGWREEIKKLSAEVNDRQLSACVNAAEQASEEVYHQLFGPGAMVSPREVSYSGFEDPGRLMAELNAFYHAFAFVPSREEPLDHLAVEAGFAAYLFLKEAYAQLRGDVESTAVTQRARARFMDEHLRRCARGVSERLAEAPQYLGSAVHWIAQNANPRAREPRG